MAQKILIVEDEEKIARFVELELLHEGYEAEKVFDNKGVILSGLILRSLAYEYVSFMKKG